MTCDPRTRTAREIHEEVRRAQGFLSDLFSVMTLPRRVGM